MSTADHYWDRMTKAALKLASVTDVLDQIARGTEESRYWEHSEKATAYREAQRAEALAEFREAQKAWRAEI